jgi:hypothetical protein
LSFNLSLKKCYNQAMSEESSVNKQLNAIADGFNKRIGNGAIPVLDYFLSDSTKMRQAAQITTDKGLEMRVYANKKMGTGTIESVLLFIEDYGQDAELQELIRKKHGDIPVKGIEVSMNREFRSDKIGEGKLIDPSGELASGVYTSTYANVSPEVTQALMERIPLKPIQKK